MTEDLVVRSLFASPPGEAIVATFRRHVADTGSPETFPQISTARPPRDSEIVALYEPININKAKRPDRGMAPCPICSPHAGKYLNGGTLIWCESTEAIYAIGPDCSASLWSDNKLVRAVNILRRTQKDKAAADALKIEARLAADRLSWIVRHRDLAQDIERLQADFLTCLPGLSGALLRASKGSSHFAGVAFLNGPWRLSSNLTDAEAAFMDFDRDEQRHPGTWVDDLSIKDLQARVGRANKALFILKRAADRMAEAAAFLSARNITALEGLSKSYWAPVEFSVAREGDTVVLRKPNQYESFLDERWSGKIGVAGPKPVPMPER